jgi:cysteinyl-tRNA synthetase
MKLQVYDSLTRKKQPLLPEGHEGPLKIYVCGPTVYQRIHIGNARTFATFLAFARYLRHIGVDVKYVSNITDVNDKIYTAANEQGMSSSDLAKQASQWYREDMGRLGLGGPDVEPLATESIAEIISLIEDLIERGLAYESKGDVYFRVERFGNYGKLSNQQVESMLESGRLEPSEQKDRPLDFVLWKATKPGEDTSWDSPWGKGRPGWHIECSAMAEKHLGAEFDVHCGGLDLIFPHHENEVAQSNGAGRGFARLWMHAGMLEIGGGEKMSKSEGNIETLKEVLDRWPSWAIILFFFGGSYRNPLEYSHDALDEAVAKGTRITEALRRSERYLGSVETRHSGDPEHSSSERGWEGIHEALHDDFNTAIALSELFGLVYDLNTAVNEHATPQIVRDLRKTILEFLDVFALGDLAPQAVDLTNEVTDLLEQREKARASKDFEAADRIRDELHEMGYVVRDTSDGVDVVPVDENETADVG